MNVTLRKATAADAATAWEIRNAAVRQACAGFYDAELLRRWTAGEMPDSFGAFVERLFYVAEVNQEVVGTGAVNLDNGQVDGIFVRPDWMGQGIGKRMIAFLVARARAAGLAELRLESTLNAAPFYRRCGFVGDALGTYQSPRGFSMPCYPMTMTLAGPAPAKHAHFSPPPRQAFCYTLRAMTDYKRFQEVLRATGQFETARENRVASLAPLRAIHAVGCANMIIGIALRCGWRQLLGRFGYDAWAEICMSSVNFIEKVGGTAIFEGFEQRAAYQGPVVYVSNHMSTLETMIFPTTLLSFGKIAIILKKSLLDLPVAGGALRALDSIPVTRTNAREDLVTVLEQGPIRLAGGSSVLLFPQGTRQAVFEARRFNSLGAKLAERAKVPVVPLAVKTDFLSTGKWIKDFGQVDPSKPVCISCGPVLMPELGAKKMHEQSVAFIERKIQEWGMPIHLPDPATHHHADAKEPETAKA